MTETTRPSERVGGKRKMTDEDDGEDVEDGRRTRMRKEYGRKFFVKNNFVCKKLIFLVKMNGK